MTKDKTIFIRNIYYMLSYAFQILKQTNFEQVATEKFEHIQDLFASILAKGVSRQLKQGLHKEYVTRHEELTILRGKLDFPNTIRGLIQKKRLITCEFDEMTENNRLNQILKTTINILVRDKGVSRERKNELRKILFFFHDIETIPPTAIKWSHLIYHRNNRSYEMLMNICYFVLEGMLHTTENGEYKIAHFSDEHMARLYEKFILEYYRTHHGYLSEVKAAQVKWNLDKDNDADAVNFLPVMQTDVFLRLNDRILIINAKYYGHILQQKRDKCTLHSNNMYQIFTYVKNQDKDNNGNVSGLLLYAKTDEAITPDCTFNISGNRISAGTLDLSENFSQIRNKLDAIAQAHFGLPQE